MYFRFAKVSNIYKLPRMQILWYMHYISWKRRPKDCRIKQSLFDHRKQICSLLPVGDTAWSFLEYSTSLFLDIWLTNTCKGYSQVQTNQRRRMLENSSKKSVLSTNVKKKEKRYMVISRLRWRCNWSYGFKCSEKLEHQMCFYIFL